MICFYNLSCLISANSLRKNIELQIYGSSNIAMTGKLAIIILGLNCGCG